MNPRTTKWFRNHAKYDDEHPRIALAIVARYARTERAQMKVMTAARRSLQLLNLALLTSSRAYSAGNARAISVGRERRVADRRSRKSPSRSQIGALSTVAEPLPERQRAKSIRPRAAARRAS